MSKSQSQIYIGIDVGKQFLDVFASPSNQHRQFENNPKGHNKILKWFAAFQDPIALICLEASGGYEKKILNRLADSPFPVARVNPKWVHHYAKSMGYLTKTDKIDAYLIAHYAEKMSPAIYQKLEKTKALLRELYTRKMQLTQIRAAEKNRLEKYSDTQAVRASINRFIRQIDKEILNMDTLIEKWFEKNPDTKQLLDLIVTVKGIGKTSAVALLALLPEIGKLNRQEIAALAGVAPMNHDSGKMHGKRFTQGGRITVRTALYMAALVASRFNDKIRVFYERLLAAGKLKKVALTACMRKLLIYVNTLVRTYYQQLSVMDKSV